jgi:hypothetical protein
MLQICNNELQICNTLGIGERFGRERARKNGEVANMTPSRTASGVGQLINRLSKADELVDPWEPAQLVALIGAYTKLVRAVSASEDCQQAEDPGQDLAEILQHGRPGSYADLERRARAAEARRKPTKRK